MAGGPASQPCEDDISESKDDSGKHYMPSAVDSTSFSIKNETPHLIAGFNNIQ
jgi:hypothetical protein